MGKVKAWYMELIEQNPEWGFDPPDYEMVIMDNLESRRPLTVEEINLIAVEASKMDKSNSKNS